MLGDFQEKYGTEGNIGQAAPTICALLSLRAPRQCETSPLENVVARAKTLFADGRARKALLYNPDAVGDDLYRRYPELLAPVDEATDFRIRSSAVMPSVTPVCFGTIYSGTSPETHGIRAYAKPVLEVETLFDVLAEAGLSAAIVAINHCSIDTIFRRRDVDYFSLRTHQAAFDMTRHLLRNFDYDVVLSYNGEYDTSVHRHGGPYSEHSLERLRVAVDRYRALNDLVDECWGSYDRFTVFAPDHGAHPKDDNGTHGDDIPEDMIVNHFYRLRAGAR